MIGILYCAQEILNEGLDLLDDGVTQCKMLVCVCVCVCVWALFIFYILNIKPKRLYNVNLCWHVPKS
jgi:hypothetical protein